MGEVVCSDMRSTRSSPRERWQVFVGDREGWGSVALMREGERQEAYRQEVERRVKGRPRGV